MGILGCNQCRKRGVQKENYLAPEEVEINFKDYSSPNDAPLSEIDVESPNNFFKHVALYEYINLLDTFTIQNSTIKSDLPNKKQFSMLDEFYQQDISVEEFQSFIENKILSLDDVNDLLGNNETVVSIFKQVCIEIYRGLELKLRQHYNDENPIVIRKKNLIPIGLIFCTCNNIEKIKLFFDLFKNEKNEFTKSEELDNFLLSDFLIASYCLISARNKIGKNNESIEELKKEELVKLINYSELKDNANLVQIFNENFFKDKENLDWTEFKKKFEDIENGFGWIFSSKGIRRKLEEYN